MLAKVISYLKFKEAAAPDVSFLEGFFEDDDRSRIFCTRQWVAKLLKDIEMPVEDFNKGVILVKRLRELEQNQRIQLLYNNIDPKQIQRSIRYLQDPVKNSGDLSAPVLETTGKGSYCTIQPNANLRKKDCSHRRIHLDLNTIALYSKVIQFDENLDLSRLDSHFYVVLRAIYIHENTHKHQKNLENAYDFIRNEHIKKKFISEYHAISLFMKTFAYEIVAWRRAIEDRNNLDNENMEYIEAVENLSLLLMTNTIITTTITMLKYNQITLFNNLTFQVNR